MIKHLAVISVGILILSGCFDGPSFRKNVTDNYYIYSEDGIIYSLTCKLACKSDTTISGLVAVQWNRKTMFLKVKSEDTVKYHFLIAQGDELSCCNNDFHIGPLTAIQVDSIMKKNQIRAYDNLITLTKTD